MLATTWNFLDLRLFCFTTDRSGSAVVEFASSIKLLREHKMNFKVAIVLTSALFGLLVFSATSQAQISLGQFDDFSEVSNAGWTEGSSSPNPPTHDIGPGPDGLAGHLQNISTGFGAAGSRWLAFNSDSRWQGDYLAAGVGAILIDFDNRSGIGTDGNFRVAFNGSGGWFISDDFLVADGTGWQQGVFELASLSHLAASGGTGVLADTLSNVTQFQIFSSVSDTPSLGNSGRPQGDPLLADFRLDNIQAAGLLGDVDLNGVVDFFDIAPFIAVLSANLSQFEADIDGNGAVDFFDIQPFIDILAGP